MRKHKMTDNEIKEVLDYLEHEGAFVDDDNDEPLRHNMSGELVDADGVRVNQYGTPLPPKFMLNNTPGHFLRIARRSGEDYEKRTAEKEIVENAVPINDAASARALFQSWIQATSEIGDPNFWKGLETDLQRLDGHVTARLSYQAGGGLTANESDDDQDSVPDPRWMFKRD